MVVKLYTGPTGNGRKPLIFLKLLNIPHDIHMFSWPTTEIKEEWYLKLNPNGFVPTLVDNDLVLCESNCILQYLAETYDIDGKFCYRLQKDPELYWQQQRWLFDQASQFSAALRRYNIFFKLKSNDELVYQNILKNVDKVYTVLDKHLAGGSGWFVGDKFTIADLAFAVGNYRRIEVAERRGDEVTLKDWDIKYPNVAKWYKKVLAIEGIEEGFKLK